MAPPAPPPAPRPAGAPRPAQVVRAHRAPPTPLLRRACTAALALEVLLLVLVLVQGGRAALLVRRTDDLQRAQMQADQIRRAWDELAEQGALMHARLAASDSAKGVEHLRAELEKAGRGAGLNVTISAAKTQRLRRGLKGTQLVVTGGGPEEKLIDFLLAVDRLPALAHVESLTLRGQERKGFADLRLTIVHDEIKGSLRNRLAALIRELPDVPRTAGAAGAPVRPDKLFVPAGRTEAQILAGWPKIVLNGFTSDRALFQIGGEQRMLSLGETITGDIIYVKKEGVNLALIRRAHDAARIYLTVGSQNYTVPRGDFVQGENEFSLIFPRGGASELFRAATEGDQPQ